ncbi:MAG: sensor histidine kinase [Solirubrobacterales bacterium]
MADSGARIFGLARLRADPRIADAALAVALLAVSLVQVLVAPIAARPVGALIAVASAAPIAWRRTYPALAAPAGSLAWLVDTDGFLLLGYVMLFVLYYSAAAYSNDARALVAVLVAGTALGVASNAIHQVPFYEYLATELLILGPAVAGRLVRRQRAQADQMRELAVHLERERERGAQAAVAEERARIARELHDVVAHGVSAMAIQADAAEAALAVDPDRARQPLLDIRGSATETLDEMRRMLGLLRDGAAEREPQPGLFQLPELVRRAEQAGVEIDATVEGDPMPLGPTADLGLYRIAQEALTNARRHAPGQPVTLRLAWERSSLSLEVANPMGPGGGATADRRPGHGLVGMRERVRLLDGELAAGPRDGCFVVRARLPLTPT